MDALSRAGAFLLASATPFAAALFPRFPFEGGSVALASLLAWSLVALIPRTRSVSDPGRELLFRAAELAPALALGLGLDLARGADRSTLAFLVGASFCVFLLWTSAAEFAASRASTRRAYAVAWFWLVPVAAALSLALEYLPVRADSPARSSPWFFTLGPLPWIFRAAREAETAGAAGALLALGGAASVLALVVALRRSGATT